MHQKLKTSRKAYFDTLNRLGVTHECEERQTDKGRTDRHSRSKCRGRFFPGQSDIVEKVAIAKHFNLKAAPCHTSRLCFLVKFVLRMRITATSELSVKIFIAVRFSDRNVLKESIELAIRRRFSCFFFDVAYR